VAVIAITLLSACANLQTVDRVSQLSVSNGTTNEGQAVHLDAQQRLLIATARGFCAEPSPDALAAYASALGFGISNPTKQAASLSNALSSNAGSIGLRTQSITLMRDALYRLCEAQQNGAIDDLQLAHLMTRSQDLTAVVLAIEQLTGAVVAPPIVLSPSPEASGTSALVANQELLETARKMEADATAAHASAAEALTKAEARSAETSVALKARRAELSALEGAEPKDEEAIAAKEKEVQDATVADEAAQSSLAQAQAGAARAKQALADATRNREAIQASRDSALASTQAGIEGRGSIVAVRTASAPDAQAIEKISEAVSGMVSAALNKNYIAENCMALLLREPPNQQQIDQASGDAKTVLRQKKTVYDMCLAVVSKGAERTLKILSSQ
jgi:hypothetical protein